MIFAPNLCGYGPQGGIGVQITVKSNLVIFLVPYKFPGEPILKKFVLMENKSLKIL